MAAPKGNQYALGNKGGKPRTYDREAEAKALLAWAATDKAYTLCSFAPTRGYSQDRLWEWAECDKEFAQAFDQAKQLIAGRLIERLVEGRSNPLVFARYGSLYDRRLRAHERELKREDVEGVKQLTITVRGGESPALEQAAADALTIDHKTSKGS